MLYLSIIEKNLWQIYCEASSPTGRPDKDIFLDVSVVVAQVVLCRCLASARAADLYRQLVALYRPAIAAALTLSCEDRAEIALGRSGGTLADELNQIRQAVGTNPIRARAFHEILASLTKLTDSAGLVDPKCLPSPERAESQLAFDPSRPALWVEAALVHRRGGSLPRSLQLLRRAASSGYPEAAQAGRIIADWVASVWANPVVIAAVEKNA